MTVKELPVGTRVAYGKQTRYGTVVEKGRAYGPGNTVAWDDGTTIHYSYGEIRALREGDEGHLPPEVVLLRMVGGPHEGDRHGPVTDVGGWPLPDRLEAELQFLSSGHYRKVSESQITDEQIRAMTGVIRGVEYEWVPTDGQDDADS